MLGKLRSDMRPQPRDRKRYILAAVLGVIALVLIVGGVQLLTSGGSAYYLLAGLSVAGSAWLVGAGDRRGVHLYLVMLVGTLVWALWESGLDGWALQARLFAPALLGIWVTAPIWGAWKSGRTLPVIGIAAPILAGYLLIPDADVARPIAPASAGGSGEWLHYGNDQGGSRFSPLTGITPANVTKLEPAWTFHTGVTTGMGFEATPLMVRDTVYLCTSNNRIFALDAETGRQRWAIDPKVDAPPLGACRGVSYYRLSGQTGFCAERIIFATTDARLMAADTATGRPCTDFGKAGTVDLKRGMGDVRRGYYYVSSAPAVIRGKVVVGGWVMDGQHIGEPSGVIRAFDAVTGAFAWAWDMDRPGRTGEPPAGESYSRGTANAWAPMSADEGLGLVYVPLGNSTPDYWGGHRSPATETYASSVVAIDAQTGLPRWHYQTAHHDLWDYDVPAQPTLIDLPIGGKIVPALIQATKRGQIFLLDRRTGTPLARIEERPAPQGAAPGDWLSPTQPYSVGMPAFDNSVLRETTMWGATPLDQLWCRIKFRQARYDGPMTPPGIGPTITYPSYLGGIDWGGVSIDPDRRRMTVNWNRMANYSRLVPRSEVPDLKASPDGNAQVARPAPQIGTPFAFATGPFLSLLGIPCTQPPFGKIAVVDLDRRKVIWERPLGSSVDSGPLGLRSRIPLNMGVPNSGGSLTTRSGLIFIAATQERAFRAFDAANGRLLWSSRLPAGGHASPMSYTSPASGRQFVVIAAGGNIGMQSGTSDTVIAYALPAPASDAGARH